MTPEKNTLSDVAVNSIGKEEGTDPHTPLPQPHTPHTPNPNPTHHPRPPPPPQTQWRHMAT